MEDLRRNFASSAPAKFELGQTVITQGAHALLTHDECLHFLRRHVTGDWGELDSEDKQANEGSLIDGSRLLSKYSIASGESFYVITEADRSVTTILLPEEY